MKSRYIISVILVISHSLYGQNSMDTIQEFWKEVRTEHLKRIKLAVDLSKKITFKINSVQKVMARTKESSEMLSQLLLKVDKVDSISIAYLFTIFMDFSQDLDITLMTINNNKATFQSDSSIFEILNEIDSSKKRITSIEYKYNSFCFSHNRIELMLHVAPD